MDSAELGAAMERAPMALSYRAAADTALWAARVVLLVSLGLFWQCALAFAFSDGSLESLAILRLRCLSVAAWSSVCMVVLQVVVFPDVRDRIDGLIGVPCVIIGGLRLAAGFPDDGTFASWFYYLSAGLCLTLGGMILVVLSRRVQGRKGGVDAHTEI